MASSLTGHSVTAFSSWQQASASGSSPVTTRGTRASCSRGRGSLPVPRLCASAMPAAGEGSSGHQERASQGQHARARGTWLCPSTKWESGKLLSERELPSGNALNATQRAAPLTQCQLSDSATWQAERRREMCPGRGCACAPIRILSLTQIPSRAHFHEQEALFLQVQSCFEKFKQNCRSPLRCLSVNIHSHLLA